MVASDLSVLAELRMIRKVSVDCLAVIDTKSVWMTTLVTEGVIVTLNDSVSWAVAVNLNLVQDQRGITRHFVIEDSR